MKKFLVVDDESLIRETLKGILDDLCDYKITETVDNMDAGITVINNKDEFDIKVAIIDVNLGIDEQGLELTSIIKKIHPEIIIVQISGRNYKKEALKAGADIFIQKPISLQTIIDHLKKFEAITPK